MADRDFYFYIATFIISVLSIAFIIQKLFWYPSKKKNVDKKLMREARERYYTSTFSQSQAVDSEKDNDEEDSAVLKNSTSTEHKNISYGKLNKNKEKQLNSNTINIKRGTEITEIKIKDGSHLPSNISFDQNSSPITKPLKSLSELQSWIPGYDEFNVAKVKLRRVKSENPSKPKTLLCHDMQGGYTDDRFPQGIASNTCYTFDYWNFIDTFVYFSHNLVTIPPPCWVNAAHCNGVKVLATFITEWKDGSETCAEFLDNKYSCKRLAARLTEIACYYGFDGWLINLENEIKPLQVDNLRYFVKELTEVMHHRIPLSQVIWYDSVTYKGNLKWQNELNQDNRMFFDVCDGIFLNYNWSVHHLARSAIIAGESRHHDIYVGVDVFGRGCFGGGGYNSYKAMQVIRDQKLSAAIFAPGWVLEVHGIPDFQQNQKKFWGLLLSYLYPHCPSSLPVSTSFCSGFGNAVSLRGEVVSSSPWTNISTQQLQPTFVSNVYQLGKGCHPTIEAVGPSNHHAYNGGGCMTVNGIINKSENKASSVTVVRLFRTNIEVPKKPFFISYTYSSTLDLDILEPYLIVLLEKSGSFRYLVFQSSDDSITNGDNDLKKDCKSVQLSSVSSKLTYPVNDSQKDSYTAFQPVDSASLDLIAMVNEDVYNGDWHSRAYCVPEEHFNNDEIIKEVRLGLVSHSTTDLDVSDFSFDLGDFKMTSVDRLTKPIASAINFRCRDRCWHNDDKNTTLQIGPLFSITLSWDYSSNEDIPLCYDVFWSLPKEQDQQIPETWIFLGRTYIDSYRIVQLAINNEPFYVKLVPISTENVTLIKRPNYIKLTM